VAKPKTRLPSDNYYRRTDIGGSQFYTLDLALKRALAVKEALQNGTRSYFQTPLDVAYSDPKVTTASAGATMPTYPPKPHRHQSAQ
jgi:hypothetical protein